ncbi:hypothetical protein F5X98DRAFT_370993 [Xylaria grammica]|nr:hypothetical protein F5X98DRAFT_370993 [Xylaria grammica]
MARIKFAQRPPPIRLRSFTESSPEYVRTPYPTQPLPETAITSEQKVYHPGQRHPPSGLEDETRDFFCSKRSFPDQSEKIFFSWSHLVVDVEKWELRLPHPHYKGREKLAHTYHIHVKFPPGGPKVERWENIAKEFRDRILSKYNMLHAAVEFTQSGGYGRISAWYPPKVDKEKLRSFFEDDGPDGLD